MSERPTTGERERKATAPPAAHGAQASRQPPLDGVEPSAGNVLHWGRGRLRQVLPRVVGRCMSYSALPEFDEALMSAVSRFYGVDVDVATAETDILEDDFERVRFFPWFLWDYPIPPSAGAPQVMHDDMAHHTIGSRFLTEAELSGFERALVTALTRSALAFIEVSSVERDEGALSVVELSRGEPLAVYDPSLAAELSAGQIALVRLIRFDEETGPVVGLDAAIDAIYAVLPHETRPMVEMELDRLLGGEREPLTVLKTHAPELLDFAEHVLSTLTEPPSPLNPDHEPVVLCQTVLGHEAARALEPALRGGAGPFKAESPVLWTWREDERVVGVIAAEGARLKVMASSRERFARVRGWLDSVRCGVAPLHSETTLEVAGPLWLASGTRPTWLIDQDVMRCALRELPRWLSRWPDEPHPAVGGKTPRSLLATPDGHGAVARLIERTRPVAGEAAGCLDEWLARSLAPVHLA